MTQTTSRNAEPTTVRGPVRKRERALAPDLTRGALLLFIAIANAGNVAFAGQPGVEPTPHGLERVINFFRLVAVDARAYPVFAVMFGYGLVQLHRRQCEAAGATPRSARRILVRRNAWLVVFGLAHATLLYFGDFLGAYGIVGLVCAWFLLPRSPKFHRIALVLWGIQTVSLTVIAFGAVTGFATGHASFVNSPNKSLEADSFFSAMGHRLLEWPAHTLTVLPFIVIVWLGIWAAQHRILEHPDQHRGLLKTTAVVGLGITFLGALPYALVGAGWVHVDGATLDRFAYLADISGEYGGPGYVALFALLAARLARRSHRGPATSAVVALGQRSLSGYLTQSVVWTLLLMPWTLHLGAHGSTVTIALVVAVLTWAGTAAAAYALDRRGRQGPAEKVLRTLVYDR
jgi:uncharacterized membrane protein YeiB